MTISGVAAIEMMMTAVRMPFSSGVSRPTADGGGVEHEGELAAVRHQHGALERLGVAGAAEAGDGVDAEHLEA